MLPGPGMSVGYFAGIWEHGRPHNYPAHAKTGLEWAVLQPLVDKVLVTGEEGLLPR